MRKHNRFGRGGVFKCMVCGHNTRDTGQGVDHLCEPCFDLAGLDNTVNDNGGGLDEVTAERDRLLAIIVKRGGDVEAVKESNSFLWPTTN